MNTKHTPGTWAVKECTARRSEITTQPFRCIADVWALESNNIEYEEMKANASLIAAAPKMFDLLVELIDMEGPQPGNSGWANRVKSLVSEVAGD